MDGPGISVSEVQRSYEHFLTRMDPEWDEMMENYDRVLGNQWTQKELKYMKKWGREPRVFNVTLPQIITLDGYMVQSETVPKAVGWDVRDNEIADVWSQLLQKTLKEATFYEQLLRASSDATIARRGRMMMWWDENDRKYKDGNLRAKRLHPLSVIDDLDSTESDIDLGRFKIFREWRDINSFLHHYGNGDEDWTAYLEERWEAVFGEESTKRVKRSMFGALRDAASDMLLSKWSTTARGERRSRMNRGYQRNMEYLDNDHGLALCIEMHYREDITRKRIMIPGGEPLVIEQEVQDDREFIGGMLEMYGLDDGAVDTYTEERISMCAAAPGVLPDKLVRDPEPYKVQTGHFMIFTISSFDYHPDPGNEISVVDGTKDMQDRLNRMMSAGEDWIQRMLNPLWKMKKGSLPSEQEYLDNWREQKPGDVLVWNGEAEPKKVEMSDLGQILNFDVNQNLEFIYKIFGISPIMQGQKEQSTSGRHLQGLVRQGELMQSPFFRNVAKKKEQMYGYAFALIQKYMYEERMVRLTRPGQEAEHEFIVNEYDPIMDVVKNDVTIGDFDIEIDENKLTPVQRDQKYEEMSVHMQYLPETMKEFLIGPWLEMSQLPNQAMLQRTWRVMLVMKYGPEILQVLESDGGLQQFVQNQMIMQNMAREQQAMEAMAAGGAVPKGAPDPYDVERDQFIPGGPQPQGQQTQDAALQ